MSRSYPIWVDVTNCNYQSSKSYGFKNKGENNIYIGSSSKNSHHFLKTLITKSSAYWKGKDCFVFKFSVDDVILKVSIFSCKNGRPDKLLKEITKMRKIKSLKI